MLRRLLSFHQIMPNILDFISVFGVQAKPRHIQFSSFREQNLVSRRVDELEIPHLARSGRQYQICYNLKSVIFDAEFKQWNVAQAAAYHQFDCQTARTLWIFVQGEWDMRDRISSMTQDSWKPGDHGLNFQNGPDCFMSTIQIHLSFCEWAMESWTEHLAQIEDHVETLVS
jgi:hypothetical protein